MQVPKEIKDTNPLVMGAAGAVGAGLALAGVALANKKNRNKIKRAISNIQKEIPQKLKRAASKRGQGQMAIAHEISRGPRKLKKTSGKSAKKK